MACHTHLCIVYMEYYKAQLMRDLRFPALTHPIYRLIFSLITPANWPSVKFFYII